MALSVTLEGSIHEVEIVGRRPHLVLRIDGREHSITRLTEEGDGRHILGLDTREVEFARATRGDRQIVRMHGRTVEVGIIDPLDFADDVAAHQDSVLAPMPGSVVSVHCQIGDEVKGGDTLVTIESMKLQSSLVAPRDGAIAEILRAEGQTFEIDDVLISLVLLAEEG